MSQLTKELKEQRAPIAREMLALVRKAGDEKRSMNEEEQTKFKRMEADEQSLATRIQEQEKADEIERSMARPDPDQPIQALAATGKTTDGKPTTRDSRLCWQAWGLPEEKRSTKHYEAAERCGFNLKRSEISINLFADAPRWNARQHKMEMQYRATISQTTTLSTGGGSLVANEPIQAFEEVLLAFGGMRQHAQVIRTATGATLPWPKVDDTGNPAVVKAENIAADTLSVAIGTTSLGAFMYSSELVRVSTELMQDSFMDWGSYLARATATRIGRKQNTDFTTGATSGTTPEGVATDIGTYLNGVTSANTGWDDAASFGFSYANLVSLIHSVDPAYRGPMSSLMMHDTTLAMLKAFTDSTGRPIWMPDMSMASGAPGTLVGVPYWINQQLAAMPATVGPGSTLSVNRRVVGYGDWSKYIVRDVQGIVFKRLDERFAEQAQTAFIAFARAGGGPIGSTAATTTPFKFLQLKTT